MVDDIHAAVGGSAGRTVECALREGGVGGIEGGFEEVGEFVEDVGVFGRLGAVICLEGEKKEGVSGVFVEICRGLCR